MNNNIKPVDYRFRNYYFLFDPAKYEVKIYKENQGLELVDTFSGYYPFPCFLKGAFETWCEKYVNRQTNYLDEEEWVYGDEEDY